MHIYKITYLQKLFNLKLQFYNFEKSLKLIFLGKKSIDIIKVYKRTREDKYLIYIFSGRTFNRIRKEVIKKTKLHWTIFRSNVLI